MDSADHNPKIAASSLSVSGGLGADEETGEEDIRGTYAEDPSAGSLS